MEDQYNRIDSWINDSESGKEIIKKCLTNLSKKLSTAYEQEFQNYSRSPGSNASDDELEELSNDLMYFEDDLLLETKEELGLNRRSMNYFEKKNYYKRLSERKQAENQKRNKGVNGKLKKLKKKITKRWKKLKRKIEECFGTVHAFD